MATAVLKRSSRISNKSCNMSWNTGAQGGGSSSSSSSEDCGGEKHSPHSSGSRRSKRQQFFSRGLSLSNFSRSFVTLQSSITRIAHLSPHSHSQSAPSSPVCQSPRGSEASASAFSTPTSTSSSSSSSASSTSTTPRRSHSHHHAKRPTCVVFGRRHGHSKRSKSLGGNGEAAAAHEGRRPVLLEKVPSGKSGEEYITVFVGIKRTNRVKYVISRDLLSHHLFQVVLKCSEDEFGQEYTTKGGIAIICDPALFLQVVKVVDDNMRESQEKAELAQAGDHDQEEEEEEEDAEGSSSDSDQ